MPTFTEIITRVHRRTLRRRKVQPKAKALLWGEDDRIVLIRHPQEGKWRLPGGFVQDDESAYDAVRRAVQDLTGLIPQDLTPIARVDESQFRADAMYGDYFQMYSTLFLVRHWQDGEKPAQSVWTMQAFPSDALPHNLHDEVPLALKALRSYQETGQIRVF
jgi:ADP-ribose pyrophosphatase YjhB (NUDIX family)